MTGKNPKQPARAKRSSNQRRIKIDLYGEQSSIFNDWINTDKHCIDILPAGSGKTFLASLFLPIAASDPKHHKGKDVLYTAPTREMIKTLIWEPLKQNCREYFGVTDQDINNGDLTIKFPNGTFIRCKSAEQREALRGMNAGIIVMDEASLYPQESLLELTNRLRPKPGEPESAGRMIVISTPYGAGPLFDLYNAAMLHPNRYIVRHLDYKKMRSGSKQFIMEQKILLSPMKFAQDYMCSFESTADQFFYTFRPALHTAHVEDRGGDLYHFADFNKRIATSIIAQVSNPYERAGKIEVLRAYAIDNCGTEQLAQTIRADFPKRRIFSVIDMSGTQVNRDTTSPFGVTDKILLEKYGFQIINTGKKNPLISDTDNSCNAFIQADRLTVNVSETKLIQSLKSYHFEDGTRKKLVKYTDKYAFIDGLGDSMRYGIHQLFPIQHDDYGVKEFVGMDPRIAKQLQPGVEYMPQSWLYNGGPTIDDILGTNDSTPDYAVW